jgi:hypothetical protein
MTNEVTPTELAERKARDIEKLAAYSKRGKAIQRRVNNFCTSKGFIKSKKSGFSLFTYEHWVFWLRPLTRSGSRNIELESGLRVLNSSWPGLHLNGIHVSGSSREVNMWFVNSDESEDRCVADLCQFIENKVLLWLKDCAIESALLGASSPLIPQDKEALTQALRGNISPSNVAKSKNLLGLA